MSSPSRTLLAVAICVASSSLITISDAFSLSSFSAFHGKALSLEQTNQHRRRSTTTRAVLTMRKQKASDKRTRRMQRGKLEQDGMITPSDIVSPILDRSSSSLPPGAVQTMTNSPMGAAEWKHKKVAPLQPRREKSSGRGRARKRSMLYNSLASYQNSFLNMLTAEYRAEEEEVLTRIDNSLDDPLALESSGYALFDLCPERRGNLFSDEVYRLTKAKDATTVYEGTGIPPHAKFSSNDVIMLTLQPRGSGDFFDRTTLPTNSDAISVEARVLNTGPTYVDIALPGGAFEAAFGPAPNHNNFHNNGDKSVKRGDRSMRLRCDRFFSNIPYERMVAALSQITSIPERPKAPKKQSKQEESTDGNKKNSKNRKESAQPPGPYDNIQMDEVLRETILSSYAFTDPANYLFHDTDACDLRELARNLAKPSLPNSPKLASQALSYMQSKPEIFKSLNEPQTTAIGAALTRRLTLIQGPPGTGKTTVASGICFGFVHQCRSISSNTKVLACAFSNVGADNLAEAVLKLGLKVVRVGKASATMESLWDHTLDAAINRDPEAQKALENAAWATSQLTQSKNKSGQSKKGGNANMSSKSSMLSEKSKRDVATAAVKASIQASNVAATKALREADVIVCTSTGAADKRLLAACGIVMDDKDEWESDSRLNDKKREKKCISSSLSQNESALRRDAPDGLPPLSLPFVVVDEACQSVEPANLIPLTSTNSCRSLVLLGDPCQLPPTVRSDPSSPLSVSLMERLAATLPQPVIVTAKADTTQADKTFLNAKPTKQAVSLLRSKEAPGEQHVSYRKRFAGSLLLSVQYRMHASIAAFSSALFYDGLLATPSFMRGYRPVPQEINEILPVKYSDIGVRFVNIGGRTNERRGSSSGLTASVVQETSYRNEPEALKIMSMLKQMLEKRDDATSPKTIGIVTPYTGQVELIKSLMASDEEYKSLSEKLSTNIEVKSVDGYQGRERDLIIFSAVRSNRQGNVGFLADWRRMNVALTRAKSTLVVVGDLESLEEGDKNWAAFGKFCRGLNVIVDTTGNDETPPLS